MPQYDGDLCPGCKVLDWQDFASCSTDLDLAIGMQYMHSAYNGPNGPLIRGVRSMTTPHKQLKTSACRVCRILSIIKDAQCDQEPGETNHRHLVVGPFLSQIQLSPPRADLNNPALLWIGGRYGTLPHAEEPKYIALFQPGFWTESCRIQPLITDFSWMQNAIADCHEHHPNCFKAASGSFVPGLRVIDCLAGCSPPSIILAPDSCRYVALSYVWGPAHPAEVAATIKDAMKVTLNLGLRFLWVDRYVSA